MKFNPAIHHRKSIRIQGYDYAQDGAYFVTICTYNRQCLFGDIKGVLQYAPTAEMVLNPFGIVVRDAWQNTPVIRPGILLDAFVIMPNHVHGIIIIRRGTRRGVLRTGVLRTGVLRTGVLPYAPTPIFQSPSQNIGAIVRGFKSSTTKQINQIRGTPGLPVWQRNYHEHIIRNEEELHRIREYIITNAQNWVNDTHFMTESESS